MPIRVIQQTVGVFSENTYFVLDEESKEGFVVDPGDEADLLLDLVARHEIDLKYILNTHAHLDHVGAVRAFQDALQIPFYLHPEERGLLAALPAQAAMFGLPPLEDPLPPDHDLCEGQILRLAGGALEVKVLETPGHSPGSVSFLVGNSLLSGDVLFMDSIGRTDLPGGDTQQLLDSIHRKVLTLPDETAVYPGHGPATTIGRERRMNPYLRGLR